MGVSSLKESLGGFLLLGVDFLEPAWSILTHLPVLALIDLNNTLVAGGVVFSGVLCIPVYPLAKKGIVVLRAKYFDKIKDMKLVKLIIKAPIIGKLIGLVNRAKGGAR